MATKKAASVKKSSAKKPVATQAVSRKSAPASTKKFAGVGAHVSSSIRSTALWRALGAEFVGTLLLASVVIVGQGQPIFVLFALVGIVLMIGGISGAHVNPAITIAAWVTRRIGWLRAVSYVAAQVLGASFAFFTLKAFLGGVPALSAEAVSYGASAQQLFSAANLADIAGKEWYVFFAEILGTAILAFAVAGAFRAKDALTSAFSAGLGIFVALMVGVTVAGYVSASSIINPAVAVALQAFDASAWTYVVYALAPVIGATAGFVLSDLLRGKK